MMRLDKYLALTAGLTRSQAKEALKQGRVTVDGLAARRPEDKVDETSALVTLDGAALRYAALLLYMLNKPAGVITATEDKRQSTVMDLLGDAARRDLFPVGRLDRDTEGLLLITNDGALAHRLLAPGRHVDKVYLVRPEHPVSEADALAFAQGLDIGDDKPAMPARLQMQEDGTCLVTLREGRFHQVKRMFEAVGNQVLYLKRLSMGSLVLDPDLAPGSFRQVSEPEKAALYADAGLPIPE